VPSRPHQAAVGGKTRRQHLYEQFVDEASTLYADALVHDQAEVSALVTVYAHSARNAGSSCRRSMTDEAALPLSNNLPRFGGVYSRI
jgi:hypothetical protein